MAITIPRNGYAALWFTKKSHDDINELRSLGKELAAQGRRKKFKALATEGKSKKSARSKTQRKSQKKLEALREQRLQKRTEELRPFKILPIKPQPAHVPSTWLLGAVGINVWWISRRQWVVVVSARKAYSAVEVFVRGQKDKKQYLIPDWDLAQDDKSATDTKR